MAWLVVEVRALGKRLFRKSICECACAAAFPSTVVELVGDCNVLESIEKLWLGTARVVICHGANSWGVLSSEKKSFFSGVLATTVSILAEFEIWPKCEPINDCTRRRKGNCLADDIEK